MRVQFGTYERIVGEREDNSMTDDEAVRLYKWRFLFRRFLLLWGGGGTCSICYYPGGGMVAKWMIAFIPMRKR